MNFNPSRIRAASVTVAVSLLLMACGEKPEAMLVSAKSYLSKKDNKAAVIQIKNALQAMRAGGILRIRTEAGPDHVAVSFMDTGHGIAPEHIGRVFEPYFTTKTTGTGLGLMIVQRIVREHGGTLDVESDTGRGTTVRLKLPLTEKRTRLLEAGRHHER